MLDQTKLAVLLLIVLLARVICTPMVSSESTNVADQSTTRDENGIFHALDTQSVRLCPGKPAVHIIFFEHLCADKVLVVPRAPHLEETKVLRNSGIYT